MRDGQTMFDQVMASSAWQLSEMQRENEAFERQRKENAERKRKAENATIELSGDTKKQNELLKLQLTEAAKSNALLKQQLKAQICSGRRTRAIAFLSLLAAIGSLAFSLWKYFK